jgi:hypothetical protein
MLGCAKEQGEKQKHFRHVWKLNEKSIENGSLKSSTQIKPRLSNSSGNGINGINQSVKNTTEVRYFNNFLSVL